MALELKQEIIELLELFRDKSLGKDELKKKLSQYHESDVAEAIDNLDDEEKKTILINFTLSEIGELLLYADKPEEYIESLDEGLAADILETMDADDAIDVLEEVDASKAQSILQEMDKMSRRDIELIQNFNEDEIGSKITTNYISFKKSLSIKEAMKTLVSEAPENDNIQNLFVIDDDGKYYGTIILKDLIIAREGMNLLEITKTEYPTLYAHELVSDVINEIKDIDLDIIPVLAENDTILGVITSQDIIETVNDELNEDYVKFAAVGENASQDDNTIFQAVRNRVPWLAMLLLLDIFTSSVLSRYADVFALLPALVLFQSWILDSSGNSGTQSLALTIRSITEDKINKKTIFKYFGKELLTGLFDGLLVGACGFGIALLYLVLSNNYVIDGGTIITQLQASGVVGLALVVAIPITTLAGLFIPLIFKKIKIDPAVASGPLITSISDMLGVAIYYTLATIMFVSMFN